MVVRRSAAKKNDKDKRRRTKQERAGLQISVSRCRRVIERKWPGNISGEASVVLAAFLQYVNEQLIKDAAASASEESKTARITSAHVERALTKNGWLRKKLIRGRVLGTAPITRDAATASGDKEEEEEEEEEEEDNE
jgi:histone H3/H4